MPKPITSIPKSNLSPLERKICWRVREVRKSVRFNGPLFADCLGIPADRLRSYEYGRAPIRYELARKVGAEFDVNLEWLTTGVGVQEGYIPLPETSEARIPSGALLSEAYETVIGDFLNDEFDKLERLATLAEEQAAPESVSTALRQAFLNDHLCAPLESAAYVLPAPLLTPFYRELNGFVQGFFARHGVDLSSSESPR